MNEITQYIQKLEDRYEKVKNEKTYYDSDEYYRNGKESELEDVISELKTVVAALKARITERIEAIDTVDHREYTDWYSDELLGESKALKKFINEL